MARNSMSKLCLNSTTDDVHGQRYRHAELYHGVRHLKSRKQLRLQDAQDL